MSSESNSKLISELYEAEGKRATEIADEMTEIGDLVFIYPLFNAFKRNQKNSISHYFISDIASFKGEVVLEILLKIFNDPETKLGDKTWSLNCIGDQGYFGEDVVQFAVLSLSSFTTNSGLPYDLYEILPYLKKANAIAIVKDDLKKIFLKKDFSRDVRAYAFSVWLRVEPKEHMQEIITNYPELKKDEDLEKIISKEISGWKNGNAEVLKAIILKEGGVRAREIISKSLEETKKKEETQEKEAAKQVENEYKNAKVISEICAQRQKINFKTLANKEIGFELFEPDEGLTTQLQCATDVAGLMKSCIELRITLKNIKIDNLKSHGLPAEEVVKLLPDAKEDDLGKPLNLLFLFLRSRGVDVDSSLFNLRALNQAVSLLAAHPNEKTEMIKLLRTLSIFELYENQEWQKLHAAILGIYSNALTSLEQVIDSKFNSGGPGGS